MNTAYLLLGSNMGNRESFLSQAIDVFAKNSWKIIAKSSLYNTAPWGNNHQGDFLNQAVCVEIMLSAYQLLENIVSIEKGLGRTRPFDRVYPDKGETQGDKKWEARRIDIDILFFNSEIIQTPDLTIPHPFLHERRFALVPLAEIAEDFVHPVLKKSVKQILSYSTDNLLVTLYAK